MEFREQIARIIVGGGEAEVNIRYQTIIVFKMHRFDETSPRRIYFSF